MENKALIRSLQKGDIITAQHLNGIASAININTRAISAPKEVLQATERLTGDIADPSDESSAENDEVFSATATDITTENNVVTDNAGNTHTNTRITQIVLTETTTGRTMTLNITY